MSYDFGIIDAQYILRRNWSIQKSRGKVNQFLLMKSFIQSVFKLKRDFGFDRALLCFDSAPYYAMLENPDYKADREYVTQESLEDMESNLIFMTDEAEIAEIKKISTEFLTNVFKTMELDVSITAEYNTEDRCLDLEFSGDDMGILIGKRGQTLDSLQYLTSLVVNKNRNSYVRIKLDTEDYRNRRKETLENLAKGIAYKVRKTRKPVVLEPMNPYERRIIHSALQGNRYVETFSEGEEPYRHVVVKTKGRRS